MTREATASDLDTIIDRLKRFHAASAYRESVPFDEETARETVLCMIERPDQVIFIHDHGVLGGILAPFFFNAGKLQAIEAFWHADRDGKSLLTAFEAWARVNGAELLTMGSLPGPKQATVDAIYRRNGFIPGENLHTKVI